MFDWIHLISSPKDRKGDFSTNLARPYKFDQNEKLYCALSEISFANNMEANRIGLLPDGTERYILVRVPIISDALIKVTIPEGTYSGNSLCDTLNQAMADTMGEKWEKRFCEFNYISDTNKVEITINGNDSNENFKTTIIIMKEVSRILGFVKKETETNFLFGAAIPKLIPEVPSLHLTKADPAYTCLMTLPNFNFVFIYIDILEHQVTLK